MQANFFRGNFLLCTFNLQVREFKVLALRGTQLPLNFVSALCYKNFDVMVNWKWRKAGCKKTLLQIKY